MKEIRSLVREVLSESFLSENYEDLNNATEEEQLAAVEKYSHAIEFIDNPSEAVQLAAVKNRVSAIKFIKNSSAKVKATADLARWMKD